MKQSAVVSPTPSPSVSTTRVSATAVPLTCSTRAGRGRLEEVAWLGARIMVEATAVVTRTCKSRGFMMGSWVRSNGFGFH